MKDKHTLQVNAIENGTVIDHIPAHQLFKVIKILALDKIDNQITFGTNLSSEKLGKKAIIKISGKYFEETETNKIALIAPDAKLNIIKDYVVTEKRVVKVPEHIAGLAKCVNPKCITNNEEITTRFTVLRNDGGIALKCHYCEKITDQDHLKIIVE